MVKIITRYMGRFTSACIRAPLFVLVETIVGLILPILMSKIVDVGIEAGDTNYTLMCGVIMGVLAIIGAVAGVFSSKSSSIAANGFGSNLRTAMYNHIQDFSFADIDRFSTASLITRTTSDVRSLQMALQMGLRVLVQAPFQLVVALVIVVGYNARLALIYLVAIPVLFTCVTLLMRAMHRFFTLAQQKTDNMNSTIQENLIAIRVVKSFVRENYERKKFKKSNDELTQANMSALSRMVVMQPMTTIILNIATLLIYWFGGKMVGYGELQSGELLAVITYLNQMMMSIMMFSMVLMQYTRAQACADRISEVLEAQPDIVDKPDAKTADSLTGRVEFKNVRFKYSVTGTGEDVLKSVSFTAEPGETVAIVGGTGSGKSSLVNLIPRFYDTTQGEVLIDGVDVRDYKLEDLRSGIGMVLQKNVLFSGTIRDNMLWGKQSATDEEIIRALKNAQAYEFVSQMSQGLDTEIHQGGTNVSGGQKQRLCIARAMLKNPAILILDDSTSAVDSDTESRIRSSFDAELKNCTVFIIAQRISSVIGADKIIVLDDGQVESVGRHSELMKSSKVYHEIYTSQQEGVLGDA